MVVYSHKVIARALRLLELGDTLELMRTSDIMLFFRNRENRLRGIVRSLRDVKAVTIATAVP